MRQALDADGSLQADLKLARVTEDLINILIENGTISFTDLPGGAHNKLSTRQGLRSECLMPRPYLAAIKIIIYRIRWSLG